MMIACKEGGNFMNDKKSRIMEKIVVVICGLLYFSLLIGFTLMIVSPIIKNSETIDNLTDTQVILILIFVGAFGGVRLVKIILENIKVRQGKRIYKKNIGGE